MTWAAIATAVAMCFVLGAAPVFVVRLIARVYPKGHDRRAELVEEMKQVRGLGKTLEQWRWLGEQFATAICDGVPQRMNSLAPAFRAAERGSAAALAVPTFMAFLIAIVLPFYVFGFAWMGIEYVYRAARPRRPEGEPAPINLGLHGSDFQAACNCHDTFKGR